MKRAGRLPRRKLIARGTVTNKMLDDAARAVVFERDGHRCLRCGSRDRLQWSHVYSRRFKSVRWSPENATTLCQGCHFAWWHHKPIEAAKWWLERFGEATNDKLRSAMKSPGKIDRKLTLLWLQQELQRLRKA